MKKISILALSTMLLGMQFLLAQNEQNKPIYLETGINLSLPVHIEMYRTHRLGIGMNFRAAKKVSSKKEVGFRFEYDYRFARDIPPDLSNVQNPDDAILKRALHRNFSLLCIKPNVQFNFGSQWYWGMETGLGFAISDENSEIGMGFVSEYAGKAQFGSCSGLYLGKYFSLDDKDKKLGISLNLNMFLAKGHAENTLALKFNYRFKK